MKKILAFGLSLMLSVAAMAQHTVVLKTGEKMSGTVESLKDGVISFKFKGNNMTLKVSEVSAVYFDNKAADATLPMTGASTSTVAKEIPKQPGEKTITSGSYTVRYKCANRVITKAPLVSNLTEEKGTVVVEIAIDKYGHVMKAVPGATGTTTDSDYLRKMAMKAAQSAMFDNIPTAPLETKGYMIITF
jgi:hypothetical protein